MHLSENLHQKPPIEFSNRLKRFNNLSGDSEPIDLAAIADEIIAKVKKTVKTWQEVAKHYHLPRNEQELMKRAFSRI